MAVLDKRKQRRRGPVVTAHRTPEPSKHAVRQLQALVRRVLDDHTPALPRGELWATAGVAQSAASLMLAGKSTNRVVIAQIAEVLCRSSGKARIFIASIQTRREIRRALERALPVLEQDAPRNVQDGLADVRQKLRLLGQEWA